MSLRIAVVCGGPSPEAEVSRASASQVAAALRPRGHQCTILEVDQELWPALQAGGFDCAFIAVHGRHGEDGTVQGVCELLGLPYTGSDVLTTALCFDKVMAKRMLLAEGLSTPPWTVVAPAFAEAALLEAAMGRAASDLGLPLVVKPRRGGSTIGLSVVRDRSELAAAHALAAPYGEVLCERFVAGIEVTVGVLGIIPPGPSRPSRSSSSVPSTTMQRSTPRARAATSSPPVFRRSSDGPARMRRCAPTRPWAAATCRGWMSSSMRPASPGCWR